MLYGAMNFPVKPILEELEAISELGFDYLELTMDPPQAHYSIIRRQKKRLLKALDRNKIYRKVSGSNRPYPYQRQSRRRRQPFACWGRDRQFS